MDGRDGHARAPKRFCAVTCGSADPGEEQNLEPPRLTHSIAKAAQIEHFNLNLTVTIAVYLNYVFGSTSQLASWLCSTASVIAS
jgi:hypothetical protein